MAQHVLSKALKQLAARSTVAARSYSSYVEKIGNREIVGYGVNGLPVYVDRLDYPMPAIRFKENTPEILALREKEKGDWKKLSVQEKKFLYRASFCQTFEEIKAPTGVWKPCVSAILVASSLALMITIFLNTVVYDERPDTFSEERKKAQLKRMIDLEINPVEGLSSQWDYDAKKWK